MERAQPDRGGHVLRVSALAAAVALAVGLLGRSLFFTVLSGLCAFALFKAVLP
ncbi:MULTISPECIES: hypothetical protein [Methylobacterium]|uniref:Uncharacterized protein n=2 Tax=Methylobacterium TaxID=407 RepID=A0A0C6FNK3_9HYPH|nr:hypothetical protein [Methylobacterium aquaticum]BAQ44195.1 hypothetical protein Maq22A_c03815 [Methylobacterium aquaticum]